MLALVSATACGRRAQRSGVVSLVPSATETVLLLGAGDKLVGACDRCPSVAGAEVVGAFASPSIERIAALSPEAVIVTLPLHARLKASLEKLGVRTVSVSPESVGEILASIETVGALVGRRARAREVRDSLAAALDALGEPGDERPTVFLELSEKPLFTAGSGTFVDELLRLAGGENAFADVAGYVPVSAEDVAERAPEVIVVLHPARAGEVRSRLGWGNVPAVRGRRVRLLDGDLVNVPGPRFVQAVRALRAALTP